MDTRQRPIMESLLKDFSTLWCNVTKVKPQAIYKSSPVCKHETMTCDTTSSAALNHTSVYSVLKLILLSVGCIFLKIQEALTSSCDVDNASVFTYC